MGDNLMRASSAAVITVQQTGEVQLLTGAADIGQGSDTVLCQVAAEELGLTPDDIRLTAADTGLTPPDFGSYSSRVTVMAGEAVRSASRKLADRLKKQAAGLWKADPGEIELREVKLMLKGNASIFYEFQRCSE